MANFVLPTEPVIKVTNYRERMNLRFGFRPSNARQLCPRYAAGLHCRQRYFIASPNSPCAAHFGWFDHSRQWIAPDGHRIFTTEPYKNCTSPALLNTLETNLADIGLTMTTYDGQDCMWYPGMTILIIVHKPEWTPDPQRQRAYTRWARTATKGP
ncbi:hypothetical protein V9056_10740, partial [Streptococcus agalactiae]|uniref:hypothetical protein n=1 Tax=Streptococcus agalactiae TaxID=1311 RepID=UPI0030101620